MVAPPPTDIQVNCSKAGERGAVAGNHELGEITSMRIKIVIMMMIVIMNMILIMTKNMPKI